jgi:zinc transport system substrate-binding protein
MTSTFLVIGARVMRERIRYLVALLLLSAAVTASTLAADERLQLIVSIVPQQYLATKIGGEHVDVTTMVGPGQSPATYEPTPRQMAAVATADLYYRIGVPFERAWMSRIRSNNPTMQLLDARDGIKLREIEPAGGGHDDHDHHDHEHAAGESDPHIWLSPPLMQHMAARLRDQLISIDPQNRSDYEANFTAFNAEMEQLHSDITQHLQGLQRREFMVFHPSWGYFADSYQLHQIPIESGGREAGANTMERLIHEAKESGAKVVFVQPQFSQKQAYTLASAIEGRVVAIDPLAADYAANLRLVAAAIVEANSE